MSPRCYEEGMNSLVTVTCASRTAGSRSITWQRRAKMRFGTEFMSFTVVMLHVIRAAIVVLLTLPGGRTWRTVWSRYSQS